LEIENIGETKMKEKIILMTLFSMLFGIIFPIAQPVYSNNSNKPALIVNKSKAEATPAKFALLIGINNYLEEGIKDLSGTENDVVLIREMLVDLYGFNSKTDVKELLSSNKDEKNQPRQKNILDNFNSHLLENAKKHFTDNKLTSPDKGATVVFYYSGHGSHLPDGADKDESDGQDETIVPMDADIPGTKDIRDDEFAKLFDEMKKYTSNITFIFDSCHSGTATRGFGERSLVRPSALMKSGDKGTDATLDESMDSNSKSYVTISGSLPNEKSQEYELPNQSEMRLKLTNPKIEPKNEMNGYLTYYLVQTLRENPGATYREALTTVNSAVQKLNSSQHPQVEGDIDRIIFGSSETRGKTGILFSIIKTCESVNEGEKVKETTLKIEAGKIVGAYPGGTVWIYTQIGDAKPLAVGEIIEATDFSATVKVVGNEILPTAKILLSTPYFGSNKRIFALDLTPKKNTAEKEDSGLQMVNRLSQKLEKNDFVTVIKQVDPLSQTNRKDWNLAVVRSTYGEFKLGNSQPINKDKTSIPNNNDEVYFLSNTNGQPLYNFYVKVDEQNAADKIIDAVEKFVRVDNLRTLSNPTSELNKGLELKIVKLKALKTPITSMEDIKEDGFLQGTQMKVGDLFSFEVINNTGTNVFPYVYAISTDGSVKLLYEPLADGDILFNTKTLKTLASKTLGKAALPIGVETFKLIAATQRFNGKLLESSAIARTARTEKGITTPLEQLLFQASTNTRDTEIITFKYSGWTTLNLDIEITSQNLK
jgi:hypothetical protein